MNQDDIIKMAKEYADEVTNGYGVVTYEFDLYGLEKFALLIRAAERERIIAANAPEIEKVNVYIKTLEDAVADEREACAKVCDELAADAAKEQDFHALFAAESCADAIRERGAP